MKYNKIELSLAFLILVGANCFSQTTKNEQPMKTNINQEERIADLENRIDFSGDDYVSLTEEEYDLLLSQPLGPIGGFEPLTTTAGGIMLGLRYPEDSEGYKTNLQIVFPYIPNISEGVVFVYIDYAKGTNGLDYLDHQGNTEIKDDGSYADDDFTLVSLNEQTGDKPFYFGGRLVNLRNPEDYTTIGKIGALDGEVELSAVSGKVVMILPANIASLTLYKSDIGIEKPFSDGVITLVEINDDDVSFHFYNKGNKNLFRWTFLDDYQNELDIGDVSENNGLYHISVEHVAFVTLYEADIIRKEIPFSFEIKKQSVSGQTSETVVENENTQPDIPEPVYLDAKDPVFLNIHSRFINDLKTSVKNSNPELPENKLLATKMESWPEEKQSQFQSLFVTSMDDYIAQAQLKTEIFNFGTFLAILGSIGKMEQQGIENEYDIRVRHLGDDQYVAEFWEDAEAHALAIAKNPPDDDLEIFKELIRMSSGEQVISTEDGATITQMVAARYTKMMALIYTLEKDGSLTFRDPFQPMIDFLKN
ncbi:MAG: hypothetical protein Q8O72_03975 [Bacteroidales bacterium]|nr:hypothetical protein [Bacteroidales bacterium]